MGLLFHRHNLDIIEHETRPHPAPKPNRLYIVQYKKQHVTGRYSYVCCQKGQRTDPKVILFSPAIKLRSELERLRRVTELKNCRWCVNHYVRVHSEMTFALLCLVTGYVITLAYVMKRQSVQFNKIRKDSKGIVTCL